MFQGQFTAQNFTVRKSFQRIWFQEWQRKGTQMRLV